MAVDSGSFLYQFLFLVDRYKKRAESVTHSRTTQFLRHILRFLFSCKDDTHLDVLCWSGR